MNVRYTCVFFPYISQETDSVTVPRVLTEACAWTWDSHSRVNVGLDGRGKYVNHVSIQPAYCARILSVNTSSPGLTVETSLLIILLLYYFQLIIRIIQFSCLMLNVLEQYKMQYTNKAGQIRFAP